MASSSDSKLNWILAGVAAAASGVAVGALWYAKTQQAKATREARLAVDERAGRTAAERKLRNFVQLKHAESGYQMVPVATVESCFPNRCGTPRQGILVPGAKGRIVFSKSIPIESLHDLETFSHAWVVFVFHENTNVTSGKVLEKGMTFPAKVGHI